MQTVTFPKFRRRRTVEVHPHRSGAWRFTCGKALSADKSRLVPRDFYFRTDKDSALSAATKVAREWNFLLANWGTLYAPTLRLIEAAFADQPHWQPALGRTPTDAEIAEYQNRPPTDLEVEAAYGAATLNDILVLYDIHHQSEVQLGNRAQSTYATDAKRIRNARRFFDTTRPVSEIGYAQWIESKKRLVAAIPSRRSASNYLDAVGGAMKWFYKSPYGSRQEPPHGLDTIFALSKVRSRPIRIYTPAELRTLLEHADDKVRLLIYLALNLGAYQADIASLGASEVDLNAGTVVWARTKEPMNPFCIKHDLWPETLKLARQFWKGNGFGWNAKHVENAFHRYCRRHALKFQFRNLRKSTSQLLLKVVGSDSGDSLDLATEIRREFLGHAAPKLLDRYTDFGPEIYTRMNRYLDRAGGVLRAEGVLR